MKLCLNLDTDNAIWVNSRSIPWFWPSGNVWMNLCCVRICLTRYKDLISEKKGEVNLLWFTQLLNLVKLLGWYGLGWRDIFCFWNLLLFVCLVSQKLKIRLWLLENFEVALLSPIVCRVVRKFWLASVEPLSTFLPFYTFVWKGLRCRIEYMSNLNILQSWSQTTTLHQLIEHAKVEVKLEAKNIWALVKKNQHKKTALQLMWFDLDQRLLAKTNKLWVLNTIMETM